MFAPDDEPMLNDTRPLSTTDTTVTTDTTATTDSAVTTGYGAPLPTTILVVEDNLPLNQSLGELLRSQGFRVQSAAHGADALAQMLREPPDLVLSDVVMPHMDGFALLTQMRQDPRLSHLPVIFLTGYGSDEVRHRAQDWGIEEYIDKPLNPDVLVEKIRAVLQRRSIIEQGIRRRVDHVRNQILGLIQHEFRTPLTLIMGYAEFMQESLETEENHAHIRESVEAILEGSHRLHHLVESFLLLANLSRDRLPEDEIFPLDPTALWRESLTMRREDLNESGLRVRLSEPDDPVIVYGVMEILREALTRLLDNAIRYRRPESHIIELSTEIKPGFVGWRIRDEGVGIPVNLLAALTDPFVRAQEFRSSVHGAGLSLTLVRRVAELHGGHLQVESQEGVGSTFTLWVADRDV